MVEKLEIQVHEFSLKIEELTRSLTDITCIKTRLSTVNENIKSAQLVRLTYLLCLAGKPGTDQGDPRAQGHLREHQLPEEPDQHSTGGHAPQVRGRRTSEYTLGHLHVK